MIETKLKVPATLETAATLRDPQNTVNKAKNIVISACHKIKRTTSENKQRVPQPYNIFYLSFLENIYVAMM